MKNYSYNAGKAHQAEKIGNLYYRYDGNGNMVEERAGGHGTSTVLAGNVYSSGDLRMTDTGFGLVRTSGGSTSETYTRYYAWDEENRLVRSVDKSVAVDYRYGADNQRSAKYTKNGESLYFDAMWAAQTDGSGLRRMKNVYVGQTRIATKLSLDGVSGTGYEKANTYYYHPDHLGSAQLVTDYEGQEYERIEYTPYGESWIEKTSDGLELLPYKFTGKELDSETGLYYYGARYLNPKTSAWLSADPALGEYIPTAPIDEEARKRNGDLPGMGGVYNLVNLALYHYAGNNPVKYTDPDGRKILPLSSHMKMTDSSYRNATLGNSSIKIGDQGCTVDAWTNIINSKNGNSSETPVTVGGKDSSYMDGSKLNRGNAYNGLTNSKDTLGSATGAKAIAEKLASLDSDTKGYYLTARAEVTYTDKDGKKQTMEHEINITGVVRDKTGAVTGVTWQGTSSNDANRTYQLGPNSSGTVGIGSIFKIFFIQGDN